MLYYQTKKGDDKIMKDINKIELKKKKYIIFDMDGTLIDSIGVWNQTYQKLIEDYGNQTINLEEIQKERDAFLHNHQNGDIYLAYCTYLIKKYHLRIQSAEELLRICWEKSGEFFEKEMDFKENVVQLILRLKSLGFTLALATMTTQFQLDIYSKKNKRMREQMDILEVFDLVTRKEDVVNKKPNPEIYRKIMQHYHSTPSECLTFEDSYTGVLASRNAGIECVNIYDQYADIDREKIREITDYSIKNYREFLNLVNETFPKGSKRVLRKTLN